MGKQRSKGWKIDEEFSSNNLWISVMMILQSSRVYYIGRVCVDSHPKCQSDANTRSYCRNSPYYASMERAQSELDKLLHYN